jgi:hypothetical protein
MTRYSNFTMPQPMDLQTMCLPERYDFTLRLEVMIYHMLRVNPEDNFLEKIYLWGRRHGYISRDQFRCIEHRMDWSEYRGVIAQHL